jgi:phosphoribosylformylglycinamidine cyclo-ligase
MDYKSSGVNIDEGTRAVNLIKENVKKTYTPNVLSSLGSFAGAFRFDKDKYEDPILVSCTDGVGTKLMLAIELGIFNTVGIDLVAMSVNDLICMGAKPLFFLDYIAVHALIPEQVSEIISGMSQACIDTDCALIGGEMAEMNDMYKKGDFDLAGFCVGVVDKPKVVDGSQIKPGQKVYAYASSGIHSNGFSLVRKVLTEEVCKAENIDRKSLLTPTRLYVKEVLELVEQGGITGICHITGGGLEENLERILPEGVDIEITQSKINVLDVFKDIQRIGQIAEAEMYKVFNMGVGMVIVSDKDLPTNDDFYLIGEVKAGSKEVRLV